MIRPFTVVCMLMAVGSGLYLYQCKHQAQVLDREIGRTIRQTDAARERIGMLRAEWAQLNEPERIADLARAHTALQTAKPTQFLAAADLAAKLPAVVAPVRRAEPADATEEPAAAEPRTPVAATTPSEPKPAVRPEPRAVADAKPAVTPAPAAVAEAKPAPRHTPPPAPTAVAPVTNSVIATAHPVPRLPAPRAPAAFPVSAEATAPGTVGAAVLEAMRARSGAAAYAPSMAAPRSEAPEPRAPAYAPLASAPAPYAPAVTSMLGGGRSALPPPVPFAAR